MVFKFKSKTKNRRLQIEVGKPSKTFTACIALTILLVSGHPSALPAPSWIGAEIPSILNHLME